ncbi:MAG: sigma-70 family RNA polymerase sigma factor [Lysobacterales bacterium]|jgi:RNA polymerase sigma-70 factor (ECF subfamily)
MDNSRDQALIERCRRGDRRALGELLGRYEKPVFNAAYRILGNPDDAADATQAVFMKAFVNLDSYNPRYKFFSWIYRIAVNESINQRKRTRQQQPLDDNEQAATPDPYASAEAGDLSREIQESLMSLKDEYRTVVVLRHFSDCSYHEISQILEIPEKTVKSRLYTARQLMRDRLLAHGAY